MNILVKILVGGGHSPTSPIAHSSLGFAMSNKIYKVSHFFLNFTNCRLEQEHWLVVETGPEVCQCVLVSSFIECYSQYVV